MKKIFCILSILSFLSPALAEDCDLYLSQDNLEAFKCCEAGLTWHDNACDCKDTNKTWTWDGENGSCETTVDEEDGSGSNEEDSDPITLPEGFQLRTYANKYKTTAASAAFVRGAYDTMNYLKENRLNDKTLGQGETASNGDVIKATVDYTTSSYTGQNTPTAPFVASVSATDGVVTVTNAEVSVPVYTTVNNQNQLTARAPIWVE